MIIIHWQGKAVNKIFSQGRNGVRITSVQELNEILKER